MAAHGSERNNQVKQARAEEIFVVLEIVGISEENVRLPAAVKGRPHKKKKEKKETQNHDHLNA